MLASLRKRQKPLSHGLIILLLGSWISYVCQPCFAHEETTGQQHVQVDKMPCHPVNKVSDQHKSGDSDKTSSPDCDCHLFIAVTTQDPHDRITANNPQGFDLPLFTAQGTELEYQPEIKDRYPIYREPDRANFPPFYRYTVLLN